jgi:putative ABC transport system permease protein
MRLLYIDQLRKIRKNLFNFISLCLLVIIITLTFTAVKSSIRRLEANYDEYLQEQQVEDFYFNMGEVDVNYLGGTAIVELCSELDLMYECGLAFAHPDDPIYINNLNIIINEGIKEKPLVYETIVDGYVDTFIDKYDFKVEKNYSTNVIEGELVYKFHTVNESINLSYIVEGELPDEDFEISIFPEFAKLNNIEIGDTYSINDTDYLVVGFHYQPEFLFPIFSLSTISFDPEYQTLVLCTHNTIEAMDQYLFTKYLIQGDITKVFGDFGYDTVQSGDLSALDKNMQLINIIMPADINFRIISLQLEVNNANAFIDIFLPMFIGFVTILLLVFMKRYIDKNKQDINTLHALGYTNNEITKSILIYPLLISFTSIIGYLLGLLVSNKLFELYSARYLFPKAPFTFDLDLLVLSIIVPIILITLINYIFILYNLNKKDKTVYKFKIRIFKFTTVKTIFTTSLLFLTISIMITFGLNGNSMFSAFIDKTKLGNNYAEMVNLQYMTNTDHLDTYHEYTNMPGRITEVNSKTLKNFQSTTIYGINPDNELKLLIDNDITNSLLLNDGIIVSDYLKTSLNIKVGDTLSFEIGGVVVTEEIVGFSNELIENNFFTTKEKLNSYFNLDNTYYNGLYVTDYSYQNPYITSRIDYQNSLDEFGEILNVSSIVLNFLIILSILLSLFIFILVLVSYFIDNRFNIAVLKSVGYNNSEINKKYLIPLYIILAIAYLVSIPITTTLLGYMLELLMDSLGFKLILDISIPNIIYGFITLNAVFVLVVYFTSKYYDKINISEVMKHIDK